ncbi:hypothetical protein JB92DRAFT_2843723 [Gautieria morchelliformis]|nr:hypothetical protein JB92DRAFT_2843723 [Gautieria morchelliformis]
MGDVVGASASEGWAPRVIEEGIRGGRGGTGGNVAGWLVGFGNSTVDRIVRPFKNDSVLDVGVEGLSGFSPTFLGTSTQEYGGG